MWWVGGGGMRPNTATSRSLLAFASTTLSIKHYRCIREHMYRVWAGVIRHDVMIMEAPYSAILILVIST